MPTKTVKDLDRDLHEIVAAVEHAANWGMAHRDDVPAVDQALQDCRELIEHVMDASILEI